MKRKIKYIDAKLAKLIEDEAKRTGKSEAQISEELFEEFEIIKMNKKATNKFAKTLEELSGIRLFK